MNNKKQRGITLIALVVTIILLLILAGITLNMAMSGNGLFSRARNATDKYKQAQENESMLMEHIADEMENINIDYNLNSRHFFSNLRVSMIIGSGSSSCSCKKY